MVQGAKQQIDIIFHYPPELTQLLINTIPLLCPSKRDVLTFFRGAGVGDAFLSDIEEQLEADRDSVNKYTMARTVLERLNKRGEPALRERREILRRVTEFEDFSTCWPNDQLKAKGLVGEISRVIGVKDSFTRMKQAQEEERSQRLSEQNRKAREAEELRLKLASVRSELGRLFGEPDPVQRGKALEGVLNRLFSLSGIAIREAFVLRVDSHGIVEQIDGVVELDGELYLVEMKWWGSPLGPGEVSQHLVRVFNRGHARGIFVSASGYTAAGILTCKESLTRAVFVLCGLEEFVLALEREKDLREIFKKKIVAAIVDKNPYYQPLIET